MTNRRQSSASMRPAVISLFAAVVMLGSVMGAAGQDHRERFVAPARQNAPPLQTYQTPGFASPAGTWQSNPAGAQTMHGLQYNPPGLNSAPSTHPIQNNPPGLTTTHQDMTTPGGLGAASGPAASQNAPGPGGPWPGGAGAVPYGSAYPVGYQPPYPAQINPPGLYGNPPGQFTCRTAHYYCVVPYTGACQCENDRRERESGTTVD